MRTKNFLRRTIWPAAIGAGLMTAKPEGWPKGKQWIDPTASVNFKAFRRTCATWFQEVGSTKDIQAQLRHATAARTSISFKRSGSPNGRLRHRSRPAENAGLCVIFS